MGSFALSRDIAGEPICVPRSFVALAGWPEPASSRGLQDQPPPGRHVLPPLPPHHCSVVDHNRPLGAILPPVTPLCRLAPPVEHGGELEFMPLPRLDLENLAEAAALPALAAGIRSQLLAPDDDRAGLLGRFD